MARCILLRPLVTPRQWERARSVPPLILARCRRHPLSPRTAASTSVMFCQSRPFSTPLTFNTAGGAAATRTCARYGGISKRILLSGSQNSTRLITPWGVLIVLDNHNLPFLRVGSDKCSPFKPTSDYWYKWDPPEAFGGVAPASGSHDAVVAEDLGPYPDIVPEERATDPEEVPPEVGIDPEPAADVELWENPRQAAVKDRAWHTEHLLTHLLSNTRCEA